MLLKDLQTLATKLATGTLFHVEKAGKAYSVDYSALAKAIIEEYADSTVGGSKQSVQAAIAALNSSKAELKNLSKGTDTVGSLDDVKAAFVARANASSARIVSFFALHFTAAIAEFPGGGDWICKIMKSTDKYWNVECSYSTGYNAKVIYPIFVQYENGVWTFKDLTTDINDLNSSLGHYWNLYSGTALTNGADILTLSDGTYYAPSTEVASTLVNKPSDLGLNCKIIVEERIPSRKCITVFTGVDRWINQQISASEWSGWQKQPTRAEVDALAVRVTALENK